ncbi:MAG: bifunctional (p)ppGpp synthetase/guanosine-3',5'-bis(diphosphate) 3'-pyrophosphohydrolase [Pseudomonadota bacterium]
MTLYQRPDFSHERHLNIDEVINRVTAYYPDADFDMIRRSYLFAENAHRGQKRSSGEDYIIHPLNVVGTMVKLRSDIPSIVAAFLHDTIEDCGTTAEQIAKQFSEEVASLVVGLTKISKIQFKTQEESQAENFRKMVVAMAKDLRVIIIKLADRMHNMRTLQYISDERQKAIAQETLDIYVPLASRLGINSVKGELEDLCLRFLKPDVYYRLAEKVAMKKSEREAYINEVVSITQDRLLEYSVQAEVRGRPKHFYSIYKKMMARGVDFEQIQDILAFRIMVSNITECYKVLGIIHSSFTPVPGRFKDYIAIPKANNYQSLHTTVIGPRASRIEIQIRTFEMDEVAETGVAAHWKYKEGMVGKNNRLEWVQELLEVNQNVESNSEFMDVVKNDLDIGGIFIFTPKGDVQELSHGSTPLDFAYAVHTEVGNHCVGAKVNGKIVPLKYKLKSGDTVEILTSKTQAPSKDWLNIVKTGRARSKIKQWLMKYERENDKVVGQEILERYLKLYNTNFKSFKKSGDMDRAIEQLKSVNEEELLVGLALGKVSTKDVINTSPALKLLAPKDSEQKIEEEESYSKKLSQSVRKRSGKDNAVIVEGMDGLMVRIARCCNPIPGDQIVGYVTRGRGVSIHSGNCTRIDVGEQGRRVSVAWNPEFSFKHPVNVRVITNDRPGILSVVSRAISNLGINIRSALGKSLPDRKGSLIFEIEVKDYSELLKVINTIESGDDVLSVERVSSF